LIPQSFIQDLLARADIVEVVERCLPLKREGANHVACCPFHNEKSPSFYVNDDKNFFHCFGCGAHGTAITFLMEHAGYSFIDAVKELAGQVGMQLPDDGKRVAPEEDSRRDKLYERMDIAARHYRQALKAHEPAVAYLKHRGLTGETAAKFALGVAHDEWQPLAGAFADYQDALLVEAGLVISNDGKRYDRCRDRVMFPIRNERGQVIAFGGRIMQKGEPKYLNSPETSLFHKGRELYGLFEHRRSIQHEDRVLVVEGYMDVVMLDQHGIDNAVATLGTAITSDQAARLLRLANEVVFAFDGDAAGRKAAWRALENSLPQARDGKLLSFLFLPDGEDPDSFVRAAGADAFRKLCDTAMPLSDFLFSELSTQTDLSSQEGKVRLATLANPYIAKLTQAPLLTRALRQRLDSLTGLESPRPPGERGRPTGKPGRTGTSSGARQGRGAVQPSSWRIRLLALLHDPVRASQMTDLLELDTPEAAAVHAVISLAREHPEIPARDIPDHFQGRPEHELIVQAAGELLKWDEQYDLEADFQGALNAVMAQANRIAIKEFSDRKPSEMSDQEKALLLASLKIRKPV
jgi:DNA primase